MNWSRRANAMRSGVCHLSRLHRPPFQLFAVSFCNLSALRLIHIDILLRIRTDHTKHLATFFFKVLTRCPSKSHFFFENSTYCPGNLLTDDTLCPRSPVLSLPRTIQHRSLFTEFGFDHSWFNLLTRVEFIVFIASSRQTEAF